MILFLNNIKSDKQKGPYTVKNDVCGEINKRSRFIRNKDEWIARVYDGKQQYKYIYNLKGELLYKEYDTTTKMIERTMKQTLCHDYSINENIKNGIIVKCLFNGNYYIMIKKPNHADIGNCMKFIGVHEYPDNYTIWGVPQYFLSIVSDEDIAANNLGYLYELHQLFNTKKWDELYKLRCKLKEEGFN